MRRWWLPVSSGVVVLALLAVTLLLVREWGQRFPVLVPGVYRGSIRDIGPQPIGFVVERSVDTTSLWVTILEGNFQPVLVSAVPVDPEQPAAAWLPLMVTEALSSTDSIRSPRSLRFIGVSEGEGRFSGKVYDSAARTRGRWVLEPYSFPSRSTDKELEVWTRLRAESAEVEKQVQTLRAEVPKQQAEIDRLTSFVTDAEKLRARAEQKYQSLLTTIETQKKEMQVRREELAATQERLRIAQRVTRSGRLVSLSRESLDRDFRWFDTFRSTEIPPELRPSLERAELVQSLLKEAEGLRKRIRELASSVPSPGGSL